MPLDTVVQGVTDQDGDPFFFESSDSGVFVELAFGTGWQQPSDRVAATVAIANNVASETTAGEHSVYCEEGSGTVASRPSESEKASLDWAPTVSIDEGLRRLAAHAAR